MRKTVNISASKEKFDQKKLRESYDKIYKTRPIRESEEHYRWVMDVLDAKKEDLILDVACGGGHLLEAAKGHGLDCVGIDVSIEALRLVKQEPTKIKIVCGDAERLPFRGESFDVITNLGSLEHFIDPAQGLHEMHRVLKKGGQAAFLLPNSYFLLTIWNVLKTGATGRKTDQEIDRWATKEEWGALLKNHGFHIERILKYNYKSSKAPTKYKLLRTFIPLNLSYCFLYLCSKP
jgi:ubiquinone/menaquinone biosynthesis C-methylase UbiE